ACKGFANLSPRCAPHAAGVAWQYTCGCGQALTATGADDLVLSVATHVRQDHPAVGIAPPAQDVLSMAEEADDAQD
ncbi:UNVERIFIED_CONTAM: hypothetical protein LJA34_09575, partial [Campylobacter jejuni]